jgi:hypothetical protein
MKLKKGIRDWVRKRCSRFPREGGSNRGRRVRNDAPDRDALVWVL